METVAVVEPDASRSERTHRSAALHRSLAAAWHAIHRRLRPALAALPVGCWWSAGLLDLVGGRASRHAAQRLLALGVLAAPAAAASGLTANADAAGRAGARPLSRPQSLSNGIVAALSTLSWWQRRRGRHLPGVVLGLAGGVLAIATVSQAGRSA